MRCNPTKTHFEVSHGPIARRAVAAYVGGDAGDRDGIAAQRAQQILQLRGVKATIAKLLDHDIVLHRLQRLVDFRAWRALEIAPLIIGSWVCGLISAKMPTSAKSLRLVVCR